MIVLFLVFFLKTNSIKLDFRINEFCEEKLRKIPMIRFITKSLMF